MVRAIFHLQNLSGAKLGAGTAREDNRAFLAELEGRLGLVPNQSGASVEWCDWGGGLKRINAHSFIDLQSGSCGHTSSEARAPPTNKLKVLPEQPWLEPRLNLTTNPMPLTQPRCPTFHTFVGATLEYDVNNRSLSVIWGVLSYSKARDRIYPPAPPSRLRPTSSAPPATRKLPRTPIIERDATRARTFAEFKTQPQFCDLELTTAGDTQPRAGWRKFCD